MIEMHTFTTVVEASAPSATANAGIRRTGGVAGSPAGAAQADAGVTRPGRIRPVTLGIVLSMIITEVIMDAQKVVPAVPLDGQSAS